MKKVKKCNKCDALFICNTHGICEDRYLCTCDKCSGNNKGNCNTRIIRSGNNERL